MSNIRHVDAPDILLTFAGVFACMDRQTALPVEVVEIIDAPPHVSPARWVRWTPKDEEQLWMLWEIGASRAAMAKIMGRTVHAINMRLKLILSGRSGVYS